jgi:RING finger/CHY zinc finger protein 1
MSIENKIREIQRNKDFSSSEKMEKIRELMKAKCRQNIKQPSVIQNTSSNPITVNINCTHYNRGCHVFCQECNKFYPCRLCHDANENHKLDRFNVEKVMCRGCKTIQQPDKTCKQCGKVFGFYYCPTCHLWECNDKKIFHCAKCGICRIGKQTDYIHCDKCNICLEVSHYKSHKCVENSTKANCPICNEYMFDSVNKPIEILKCGHSIHQECFKNMVEKTI